MELYPSDEQLLTLEQDEATGVEYIPTGKTPYYLEFRKLIQRLLLASGRANEFRPYQDGSLSIGVRSGRVVIDGDVIEYEGEDGVSVDDDGTNHVYLDSDGVLVVTDQSLPVDRTTHLRIATIIASDGEIESITDLRGEASNQVPVAHSPEPITYVYDGTLSGSLSNKIAGIVPVDGTVVDVILTVGSNMVSDDGQDGTTATARVNSTTLCSVHPSIVSADGSGLRSTAHGDGTEATIKDDGTEQVQAGDLITISLTRTANGNVSSNAQGIVAAVLVRPDYTG